jgi:RimJ/RimL family protein N-acetyltransferase
MKTKTEIQFIPLEENHLTLIFNWLKADHIRPFWQDPENFDDFKHKYLIEKPKRFVTGFMIQYQGQLMGYIQYYHAQKVGGGWWPEATDTTYGLDLMIGETIYLSQGLGTRIILAFIHQLKNTLHISELIADPDLSNIAAIRCFEKVGFKNLGLTPTPYGEALLLKFNFT